MGNVLRQNIRASGSRHQIHINQLPSEILTEIFNKLDPMDRMRARDVCFRWREVIDGTPSLWRDIRASVNLDTITARELEDMTSTCVRKICIEACTNADDLKNFIAKMPWLQTLDTCRLKLTEKQMLQVFSHDLPRLEDLQLNVIDLNTEKLQTVLKHLVNLQALSLSSNLDLRVLSAVIGLKCLQYLTILCRIQNTTEVGPSPMLILEPNPRLKKLNLTNVTVDDKELELLSQAFPQLEYFQAELSPDVSDAGMEVLASLEGLRALTISGRILKDGWMNIVKEGLPKLESLYLQGFVGFSDQWFLAILKMPVLKDFRLFYFVQTEALPKLQEGFAALKVLALHYTNVDLTIFPKLPNLEHLALYRCDLGDEFWRKSFQDFTKLKTLRLGSCLNLSAEGLSFMSQMPSLVELHLASLDKIGNTELRRLSRGKARLICLGLWDLHMSDEGLLHLSRHLKSLRQLSVVCCDVTEEGIIRAVSNLPELECLETHFDSSLKKKLKPLHPYLRVNQSCFFDFFSSPK